MANPQLVTYIKQQRELGESETPIRNSLRSVGWAEADINDAVKEAMPGSAPTVSAPVSNAPAISPSPAAQEPRKINLNTFGISPGMPQARPGVATASPAAISFTAPAQKPIEAAFSPSGSTPAATGSPVANFAPIVREDKKSGGGMVGLAIMGVLVVALGGFAGYLYKNNMNLQSKLDDATGRINALSGRVESTSQSTGNLEQVQKALADDNADLISQLALFLPPKTATSSVPGVGTTTPSVVTTVVPLTLKGTLTSSKGIYILTTSRGIAVSVKNSKDAKVDAALKPFLSSAVSLTGTQVAGVRELTVTQVNGVLIK